MAKRLTAPKTANLESAYVAEGEPSSRVIEVKQDPSKTPEQQVAGILIEGVVPNADVAATWQKGLFPDVSINATAKALREHVDRVKGGDLSDMEALLVSQSYALNAVFVSMTRQASNNRLDGKALDLTLRLAFKAQAQCRSTVEALGELKNPRQVTFAKQANIAHGPQQVNNGAGAIPATETPARTEEQASAPTQLLEVHDAEWVDAGAKGAPAASNPELATVVAIDRATNRRRKAGLGNARVQGRQAASTA